MTFGEKLKKLRESRGLTVNQLAIYSGVSSASISRYETGERGTPKPPTIEKLAKGLKMDYSDLMKIAGHYPDTNEENDRRDPIDKFIEYLDMELTDEEIIERMNFKIDNMVLDNDDIREFIAFVRAKRFMKTQQSAPSNTDKN